MEKIYTIVFLVGVIYTVVTFLLGGLLDFAHFGGHIDTHIDGHFDGMAPTFAVLPMKPITIISFVTVFGGIGIMGTHYKLNAIVTFIMAILSAYVTAQLLYRVIVIPLYRAQNTSSITQEELVGTIAKVISPVFENGFGTISYVVNGSKCNAPAQHINKKAILQGEDVVIYEIKGNVFYVHLLNEKIENCVIKN